MTEYYDDPALAHRIHYMRPEESAEPKWNHAHLDNLCASESLRLGVAPADVPAITAAMKVLTCRVNGEAVIQPLMLPPNTVPPAPLRGEAGVRAYARSAADALKRRKAGPDLPTLLKSEVHAIAPSVGKGFEEYASKRLGGLYRDAKGIATWSRGRAGVGAQGPVQGKDAEIVRRALSDIVAAFRIAQRQPEVERRLAELRASKEYKPL